MQRSTMSLFEREIRAQVDAARRAVREAERGDDLALADAARAHLQSLVDLAGRNGVSIDAAQPTGTGTASAGTEAGEAGPELAPA